MSDKIKSDYTEYMENVEPSDEFLSRLTQTLKDEQNRQKHTLMRCTPCVSARKGIKIRRMKQMLAAAACFLMFFCISMIIYLNPQNNPHTGEDSSSTSIDMIDYAEKASAEAINTVPFKNIGWYDDNLTGESVPKALAQKLVSSLDYLLFGSENLFVNAERADAERTRQIIELLSEADETAEEISGTKLYYMAVFTDGTVAKFSITNDTLIEISGDEKSYKKAEN